MKIKNVFIMFCNVLLSACTIPKAGSEKLSYNPEKYIEQLTQRKFDEAKANEEMSRERTEKRIPFTMNFKWCFGKPVIDFDPEHHIYMQVDTGFTRNWYYTSCLRKMGLSDEDFMKEVIAEVRKNHTDVSEAHPSDEELKGYNLMDNSSLDSSSLIELGWKGAFSLKEGVEHTLKILQGQ